MNPALFLAGVPLFAIVLGCIRAPSPLRPFFTGSIGLPHNGVLTRPALLADDGDGYRWLRRDDRHFGVARFTDAIARAAKEVALARPGSRLVVGDLSSKDGGLLMPHFSHRTGRDADLLFYVTTLEGAPLESPGFVRFGSDGLGWDDGQKHFIRFDVEREWLLIRALLLDDQARVQWIFVNRMIRNLLLDWAIARGEKAELLGRAQEVMAQPTPGGLHDDHVHVRTTCTAEEIAAGCERSGPERAWLAIPPSPRDVSVSTETLVLELLEALPEEILTASR